MRTTLLRQSQLLLASKQLFPHSRAAASPLRHLSTPSVLKKPTAFSPVLAKAGRFAAFSTSTSQRIMPPGPQVIEGTVNDPVRVPKPSPLHGSYHWTFERALSVALVPLTLAPFAAGSINAATDAVLVFVLLLHSHIGFQSCVTDYFSTTKHPKLRKFFDWLLNITTVLVAVSLYEFETNDVGLTEAIKRIWTAGRRNTDEAKA
ncbi:hypothetical protein DV738_g540, partial [Chaetothyriales sp. CBS 135597]